MATIRYTIPDHLVHALIAEGGMIPRLTVMDDGLPAILGEVFDFDVSAKHPLTDALLRAMVNETETVVYELTKYYRSQPQPNNDDLETLGDLARQLMLNAIAISTCIAQKRVSLASVANETGV